MATSERDDIYLAESWAKILPNLNLLFNKQKLSLKYYMNLHSDVVHYCQTYDKNRCRGAALYLKLKEYLILYCNYLIQQSDHLKDEDLLRFYSTEWEMYQRFSKVLNCSFIYLNKNWIKISNFLAEEGSELVLEVGAMAIVVWKDVVFQTYNSRIVNIALRLIDRQRYGEIIDSTIIQSLTSSYVIMGKYVDSKNHLSLYQKHFEKHLIKRSENFYVFESLTFLVSKPVREYLKKVDKLLDEEANKVAACVDQSSKNKLIKTVERTLIQNHLEELHIEFIKLLKLEKNDDLKLLYSLVNRNPEDLKKFFEPFQEYVHSQGLFVIEQCGEEVKSNSYMFMDAIISVYKKYLHLISTAFDNNIRFKRAFDKACSKFVNQNFTSTAPNPSRKPSELLAKYCDSFLKQSNSSRKEDVDQAQEDVMTVFRYILDKDVFQDYYMKCLAKRLVNQTSYDKDCETVMILKLKRYIGAHFTSKFERMLSDVTVSTNINKEFDQSKPKGLELDFDVKVLQFGSWPFYNSLTYTLPSELDKCITEFSAFYTSKHTGKKLTWLYNLSKGEVVTTNFKKRYTIQSSNMEITILMLFNKSDTLSLAKIHEQSFIEMESIKQIVQILLKAKIIVISGNNEENLTPDSTVFVNKDYNNKKLRININKPIKQDVKRKQEIIDKNLDERRKFVIQAAIVRIMKSRKSLKHSELMSEVVQNLSGQFKPSIAVIKKSIELLIEKDFIERDVSSQTYTYLA